MLIGLVAILVFVALGYLAIVLIAGAASAEHSIAESRRRRALGIHRKVRTLHPKELRIGRRERNRKARLMKPPR